MRIAKEEIRQAADALAATAVVVHQSHNTASDWQHCSHAVCMRAARVQARLLLLVGPPAEIKLRRRQRTVDYRLERMLG